MSLCQLTFRVSHIQKRILDQFDHIIVGFGKNPHVPNRAEETVLRSSLLAAAFLISVEPTSIYANFVKKDELAIIWYDKLTTAVYGA